MASSAPTRRSDNFFESALAASNFLIENRPNAKAFYDRGNLYGTTSDYRRAIADYSRAIELDPAGADAYCDRGLAYASTGAYERATSDLTKALELRPGWIHAYFLRGNIR